ncbi:MAG: histidine kinase [Niabella sp.]|nr:histidine kinase [Niabella sp.]
MPVYEYKAWGFDPSHAPLLYEDIKKRGLLLIMVKTFLFNSLLAVVVPQILFVYFIIYRILPNYFYRKRNLLMVVGVLISTLLIYWLVVAQFKWFAFVGDYLLGLQISGRIHTSFFSMLMTSSLRDQAGSLPIVAGYAIMITLMKRWWLKQKEAEQLVKERNRAELQLLKAQVHPHFLFNTLNNIYFFTLIKSPHAPEMIQKLSTLLHYILNDCSLPVVPLNKEISMIKDYIALEAIRYGQNINLQIEIPSSSQPSPGGELLIAPLLLIPFVENSFKHGASKMLGCPYVKLCIRIEDNNTLHFSIENSQPQTREIQKRKGKIGLKNVKQRLQLLYPGAHELSIISKPERFTVDLKIELQGMATSHTPALINEYAMA